MKKEKILKFVKVISLSVVVMGVITIIGVSSYAAISGETKVFKNHKINLEGTETDVEVVENNTDFESGVSYSIDYEGTMILTKQDNMDIYASPYNESGKEKLDVYMKIYSIDDDECEELRKELKIEIDKMNSILGYETESIKEITMGKGNYKATSYFTADGIDWDSRERNVYIIKVGNKQNLIIETIYFQEATEGWGDTFKQLFSTLEIKNYKPDAISNSNKNDTNVDKNENANKNSNKNDTKVENTNKNNNKNDTNVDKNENINKNSNKNDTKVENTNKNNNKNDTNVDENENTNKNNNKIDTIVDENKEANKDSWKRYKSSLGYSICYDSELMDVNVANSYTIYDNLKGDEEHYTLKNDKSIIKSAKVIVKKIDENINYNEHFEELKSDHIYVKNKEEADAEVKKCNTIPITWKTSVNGLEAFVTRIYSPVFHSYSDLVNIKVGDKLGYIVEMSFVGGEPDENMINEMVNSFRIEAN